MPSLRDLAQYAVPIGAQVAGGLLNRRAAGNAVNRLGTGFNTAIDIIRGGADQSRRTMADVYQRQRDILEPFRAGGTRTFANLEEGVRPGGEFNTPFNSETFDLYKDPGFKFRLEQGRRSIEAGANVGGIRFSPATLKALSGFNQDMASQEFANANQRYQQDVQNRFGRVRDVAGMGEDAARTEVDAGAAYGANLARLDQTTAAQVADLQAQIADAEATGDIVKANTLNDTLSGILGTVEQVGTARSLAALAGGGGSLASIAGGSVPAIGGMTLGGASPAAMGAGTYPGMTAAGAGAGGAGTGATVTGLLTNPVTIAAGAALGVGLLWRNSQAHRKADEWVKTQNSFDQQMRTIDGQGLAPEQSAELKRAAVVDYLAAAMNFARKGGDHARVIRQAIDTFRQFYGDPTQYAS